MFYLVFLDLNTGLWALSAQKQAGACLLSNWARSRRRVSSALRGHRLRLFCSARSRGAARKTTPEIIVRYIRDERLPRGACRCYRGLALGNNKQQFEDL